MHVCMHVRVYMFVYTCVCVSVCVCDSTTYGKSIFLSCMIRAILLTYCTPSTGMSWALLITGKEYSYCYCISLDAPYGVLP